MNDRMLAGSTFAETVRRDLTGPLLELCELLAEEGALEECSFFSNIIGMLGDPEDEAAVLQAVIELSRCAFLGFQYSELAAAKIDQILERSITLSHTMSAPGQAH